jgi:hypothetical protein
MGRLLSIMTAALLGSTVTWAPVPALAADSVADVDPPVITSTGRTDGQLIGRDLRLHPVWTDNVDVTRVEVLLNGVVKRSYLPNQWQQGLRLSVPSSLHDTDVDLTVRAFDEAGNQGEATTRVHVDTVAPTVATLSPPFKSYVGGVVTIAATDVADDLAKVRLWDYSTASTAATATAAPWTLNWHTGDRTDVAHVLVVLTDKAGNDTLMHGFYGVDNTGPTITKLHFPLQPDGTIVEGRVSGLTRLTVDIDSRSTLDRVEWWVDGTLRSTYPIAESGGSRPHFDWDTGTTNGTAELEIRAYNTIGNHTTMKRSIVIDNTGPTIASITPKNRALVRGAHFNTTVKATDASGILEAYLQNAYIVDQVPYTVIASAGKDGLKTLTWTVTDRLGNTSVATRTVIIDNTTPKVTITKAPRNGAKVKGTITVTASASDRNGINRVELLINGKVVATDTKAAYTFSVKTKKYGKKFTVALRGYDKTGNATKTSPRTWRR